MSYYTFDNIKLQVEQRLEINLQFLDECHHRKMKNPTRLHPPHAPTVMINALNNIPSQTHTLPKSKTPNLNPIINPLEVRKNDAGKKMKIHKT